MSDHYIAHLEPTEDQHSTYTTLSGALTPTFRPQYKLPQDVYRPMGRTLPAGTMNPILFQEWSGAPWVPLPALRTDHAELAHNMVDGWDLIFRGGPTSHVNFEFRIMWPGYNNFYVASQGIRLNLDPQTTTRAMLAKIIGTQIEFFMEIASGILTAPKPYKIGHDGIQSDQVLLGGIENIYEGIWQANLYIDSLMHV